VLAKKARWYAVTMPGSSEFCMSFSKDRAAASAGARRALSIKMRTFRAVQARKGGELFGVASVMLCGAACQMMRSFRCQKQSARACIGCPEGHGLTRAGVIALRSAAQRLQA